MLNFGRPYFPTDLRASDLVESDPPSVAVAPKTFSVGDRRAEFGGGEGARTPDLRLAKPALCQLSYAPRWVGFKKLVAGAGFEPATFGL